MLACRGRTRPGSSAPAARSSAGSGAPPSCCWPPSPSSPTALQLDIARSFVVFTVPAITLVTLFARFVGRKWLQAARRRGRCIKRVVAVGRDAAVADLVRRIHVDRYAGMEVVAACVTAPRRRPRGVARCADRGRPGRRRRRRQARTTPTPWPCTSASETAAQLPAQAVLAARGQRHRAAGRPGPDRGRRPPPAHPAVRRAAPAVDRAAGLLRAGSGVLKGALDRCGAAAALVRHRAGPARDRTGRAAVRARARFSTARSAWAPTASASRCSSSAAW